MSLSKNLRRNFGAALFSRVTYALYPVLSVPLFLHFWGKQAYGGWLVLTAVPAWLTMADLGFGSVAANEMSLRVANGDAAGAKRSLHSAWVAIIIISLAGMAITVPLAAFLPWGRWVGIKIFSERDVARSLCIFAATIFVGFQSPLLWGVLRARGRAAIGMFYSGLKPLLDLAAIGLALRVGCGIEGVAAALLISQSLFTLIYMIYAASIGGSLQFGVRMCCKEDLWRCFRKGAAFSLFPLGHALLLQGSLLAVNAALGPVAVVIFGTARTLTRSAWQIMNMINSATWSEFSHLLGAGDAKRARGLHRLAVQSSLAVGSSMAVGIILFGPFIYQIWTAHNLSIGRDLLVFFGISIVTNSLWLTSSVVPIAANRHEALAWRYVVGTALNVPLCYFLSRQFGLRGSATSSIIVDLIMVPSVVRTSLELTNDSLREFCVATLDQIRTPGKSIRALRERLTQ